MTAAALFVLPFPFYLRATLNGGLVSNPREAALQGLAKMKALKDAGYVQGVLPPQLAPASRHGGGAP